MAVTHGNSTEGGGSVANRQQDVVPRAIGGLGHGRQVLA
jgi:hypothetical protein